MAAERIRFGFLKVAGYLIPLVQSIPAWSGLMTLPFAGYLVMMFANLPVALPQALLDFFVPFLLLEKAFVVLGFLFLIYSTVHLITKRSRGLVTSGPYRLVRHPQYLGMILSTLGLTSWSVWILTNTFGIGFLSPSQTLGVWLLELAAYILLAYLEEQHLLGVYGASFKDFKRQVPFLIPVLQTGRGGLDLLLSFLVPSLLLLGVLALHQISPLL